MGVHFLRRDPVVRGALRSSSSVPVAFIHKLGSTAPVPLDNHPTQITPARVSPKAMALPLCFAFLLSGAMKHSTLTGSRDYRCWHLAHAQPSTADDLARGLEAQQRNGDEFAEVDISGISLRRIPAAYNATLYNG
ncbi:hypothetical protein DL763_005226 [Monosporascus cannonballus]|nr:hypothetical protein DL763_005226 [Monosporascus cannonballus]